MIEEEIAGLLQQLDAQPETVRDWVKEVRAETEAMIESEKKRLRDQLVSLLAWSRRREEDATLGS